MKIFNVKIVDLVVFRLINHPNQDHFVVVQIILAVKAALFFNILPMSSIRQAESS